MGSRRGCEELIRSGQVTINGSTVSDLATRVQPTDVVKVGNRVLHTAASMTLILHKPPGFVCTASDTHDRRTIFDLLPSEFPRLFHVGRLDKESEGLLILTNDGTLSLKLTHPRYKVEKEYEVVLDKPFDFEQVDKLLRGIRLQDGWAKAEAVFRLGANKLKVVLRQGMKRQIRLMFHELGYEVEKLVRVRIGSLRIEGLPPAHWRALKQDEIAELVAGAGIGEEEPAEQGRENAPDAAEAPVQHLGREAKSESPVRKPVASRTPRPQNRERERSGRTWGSDRSGSPQREGRPQQRGDRFERGGRGYEHRPYEKRPAWGGDRPARPDRPQRSGPRGDIENIPFVPRASREGAERSEGPRGYGRENFRDRPTNERGYDRGPRNFAGGRREERPDRDRGPSRPKWNADSRGQRGPHR